MKNYAFNKKLLSLSFAILMMATISIFFAFKPAKTAAVHHKLKQSTLWYQYDGSGSATSASNYNLISPQPSANDIQTLCPGSDVMCAVKAAAGSGTQPAAFSSALSNEIDAAIDNSTPSSNVRLRDE